MSREMKFVENPYGSNQILSADGFYISFNLNPCCGIVAFQAETSGGETALCFDNKFKILNGDFRAEYEKLAPLGLDECIRFFNSKPELISSWSSS